MALTYTPEPVFGTPCPDFRLPGVDEREWCAADTMIPRVWRVPSAVKNQELRAAIMDLIHGRTPSKEQRPSMGCNIKWK